jgi:uncharacterized membrane protein
VNFLNSIFKKPPLSAQAEKSIVDAIRIAESNTSAELRVHIGKITRGNNAFQTAKNVFLKTGMNQTLERNGVLIFISFDDRKFALLGDVGIDEKVPEHFWTSVRNEMQTLFAEKKIVEAILLGVHKIGEELSLHFPAGKSNPNELNDEISFD